ncbi:hypothetical protein [Ulvibacterium marinum]|nr:hypothetical protein [Ulvibacterium marinum]
MKTKSPIWPYARLSVISSPEHFSITDNARHFLKDIALKFA